MLHILLQQHLRTHTSANTHYWISLLRPAITSETGYVFNPMLTGVAYCWTQLLDNWTTWGSWFKLLSI